MSVVEPKGSKGTRRESAYDLILAGIIFADLPPGSVVDDKTLARRLGLGLAAVRDALYRLSLEGLVERRPRVGTRIPELSLYELQDVFEARILLEGSCAALAAERASADDVRAMRETLSDYVQVINRRDFRRLVRMDRAFHGALGAATHNKLIEQQVILLHNNASRFWYFGLQRLDAGAIRADIKGHVQVIDWIEKRRAVAARNAMQAVLGHFPDNVRIFLSGGFSRTEGAYDVTSKGSRWDRKRSQSGARSAAGVS